MIKNTLEKKRFLLTLLLGSILMIATAFVIHGIEGRNREAELIEEWNDKGKECMEEPHAFVSHGRFVFECQDREETPEEKTFREVPASYFDFERRGDLDYLLQYLKSNPPTYDCALIDKYWKRGTPCWDFINKLKFNPQEYR